MSVHIAEAQCRPARVVNVSSEAHKFGNIDVNNPNLQGKYNNWLAYGQSKLANVMFTFELARRLPAGTQVDANTLHPGVVSTELARCVPDGTCAGGCVLTPH